MDCWFVGCFIGWLVGFLAGCLDYLFVCWLFFFFVWLVGWFVGGIVDLDKKSNPGIVSHFLENCCLGLGGGIHSTECHSSFFLRIHEGNLNFLF